MKKYISGQQGFIICAAALCFFVLCACQKNHDTGGVCIQIEQLYEKQELQAVIDLYSVLPARKQERLPPLCGLQVAKAYFFSGSHDGYIDTAALLFQQLTNQSVVFLEPRLYLARIAYFYRRDFRTAETILREIITIDSAYLPALSMLLSMHKDNPSVNRSIARNILKFQKDIQSAAAILLSKKAD